MPADPAITVPAEVVLRPSRGPRLIRQDPLWVRVLLTSIAVTANRPNRLSASMTSRRCERWMKSTVPVPTT